MTEHRESIEIDPEVESPVARRVARPRLIAAVAVSVGFVWLAVFGVRSLMVWVASRPGHQLPFARIELVPPPDPWIVGGRARILEQVRAEAKLPELLPLLELDLRSLRNDFRRCPWIKDVIQVKRSYGQLTVQLVYRKPVAVVVLEKKGENGVVIDEEAVPLASEDIEWRSKAPRYEVRGIASPLIEIHGVLSRDIPPFGIPWKKRDAAGSPNERDPMVLGAAGLAEFLQRKPKTTLSGRKVPDFVAIRLPDEPIEIFFLRDSDLNWFRWGEAPGAEKPGEPSADDKWKMLLDRLDHQGPIEPVSPNFFRFSRTGLELVQRRPPSRKPSGSR